MSELPLRRNVTKFLSMECRPKDVHWFQAWHMRITCNFSLFLLTQVQIILYLSQQIHSPPLYSLLCVLGSWQLDCIIGLLYILAAGWVQPTGTPAGNWGLVERNVRVSGWPDLLLPGVGLAMAAFLHGQCFYQIALLHGSSSKQPLATVLSPLVYTNMVIISDYFYP